MLQQSPEGSAYVNQIKDQRIQDLLSVVKEQMNATLPLTLNKRCDERFGFSDSSEEHLAIPYIANKIPSPTSRFKNPNTIMNYTTQTYLTKGIPHPILKDIIGKFQKDAMQEVSLDSAKHIKDTAAHKGFLDSAKHIKDTAAHKGFMELCGNDDSYNLMRINDKDIERMANRLQSDPNLMFAFLRRYIYPDVKIFPKEISANALSLVNMLFEVQGFTGTPWNSETYHNKLATLPEIGTDGKTLAILWKRSKDLIHGISTSSFPTVLDQLLNLPLAKEKFNAIIDSGSLFNGVVDNDSVARELLERLPASHQRRGLL